MANFGIPGQNIAPLAYSDTRLATVPMVQGPRAPTVNDKKYPLWCEWRVSKDVDADNQEGDWWKLVDFVAGDAIWVKVCSGTSGPTITISDTAGTKVSPDDDGNIQLEGTAGQINIVADPNNHKHVFSLAGGGTAIDQLDVDLATIPGVKPVDPDGTGKITIVGNVVGSGANVVGGSIKPVATHTTALNQFNIEVQVAKASPGTPTDKLDTGLCSFNTNQFKVSTHGYVELVGASNKPAIQTLTGNSGSVVNPDSSGNIDIKTANSSPKFVGSSSQLLLDFSNGTTTSLTLGVDIAATLTTATGVTAIGYNSGAAITSGDKCTFVGADCGASDSSGVRNTAVGWSALKTISTTDDNTAIGYLAGWTNTGTSNTCVGSQTMTAANAASYCSALGYKALNVVSGSYNVANGWSSFSKLTSGQYNSGLGNSSFSNLLTGSYNCGIGYLCGNNYTGAESSNICIMNAGTLGESNAIRIGSNGTGAGLQDKCYIAGITGVTVPNSEPVSVDGNGQLGGLGQGNVGEVLTSNGSGTSPTWKPISTTSSEFRNIGIGYNSGTNTFTVHDYKGDALGPTNVGIIWLQSKANPGRLTRYTVTANQTFSDGAAGQILTMRWGVTTGINWANDAPFYLYAVGSDNEQNIAFAISRIPHRTVAPAAAKIGKQGALVNVSQSDMYLLPDVTVGDYDGNPCACIGSFRMQFTGATDYWTVQTLNNTDGVGEYNENQWFTFPAGQMGADSGKYFVNTGGGTRPVFTNNYTYYRIDKTGYFEYSMQHTPCTTPGAGAFDTAYALPYRGNGTVTAGPFGQHMGTFNTTGPVSRTVYGSNNSSNPSYVYLALENSGSNLQLSSILATNTLQGYFTGLAEI